MTRVQDTICPVCWKDAHTCFKRDICCGKKANLECIQKGAASVRDNEDSAAVSKKIE